ncbi:MAG: DUF4062 domain-containing protein, partial [Candidatus Hermodarchaeota archaeon]
MSQQAELKGKTWKVFLSSTYTDLKKHKNHRDRAKEAIERLGTKAERMEVWGALPGEPLKEIEKKVKDSHLFVGLYAHKYGTIPPEQPPGQEKSFIEWEFDFAKGKK